MQDSNRDGSFLRTNLNKEDNKVKKKSFGLLTCKHPVIKFLADKNHNVFVLLPLLEQAGAGIKNAFPLKKPEARMLC